MPRNVPITEAEFPNFGMQSGVQTFSYAELLAQIEADLTAGGFAPNPNVGKGVSLRAIEEMRNIVDNTANQLNWRGTTPSPEDPIVHFDDLGFYSNAAPTFFTIPDVDPPITRVFSWLTGFWGGTRGANTAYLITVNRNLFVSGFSGESRGLEPVIPFPNNQNRWMQPTGIIEATTGDQISWQLTPTNVGDNTTDFISASGGLVVVA